MSSKQILNHNKSRKTKKIEKEYPKKEKNKEIEERQVQQTLPRPIIYQDRNQRDIELADDNENENVKQEQTTRKAKEVTNYYLELHKNMINTYNSVYSQILQDIFNSSWNGFTSPERFTDYPFDNKNMYTSLISNRADSLILIDNIMTKNLNTFMKSLELTQRFYKNIIESYLNCIKK
ncbi:MAG: hypothetical protein ACM3VV_02025 [Deltaproteobacteria bacterium]